MKYYTKYAKALSRDIIAATQKVKDRFDDLCVNKNFYLDHFNGDRSELIQDKEGFFSELVMQEMYDEAVELIRAILTKKDWVESDQEEYMHSCDDYGVRPQQEITEQQERMAELKKIQDFLGNECDIATEFNFNLKG